MEYRYKRYLMRFSMIFIGYVCAVYVSEATKKHQLLKLSII